MKINDCCSYPDDLKSGLISLPPFGNSFTQWQLPPVATFTTTIFIIIFFKQEQICSHAPLQNSKASHNIPPHSVTQYRQLIIRSDNSIFVHNTLTSLAFHMFLSLLV